MILLILVEMKSYLEWGGGAWIVSVSGAVVLTVSWTGVQRPCLVGWKFAVIILKFEQSGFTIVMHPKAAVAGRGSSIRIVSAWHASGPEYDPHIRHILSWRLGHENILQPFSHFRWFKKSSCQLLAKECALSTCKLPRRLAKEQCG